MEQDQQQLSDQFLTALSSYITYQDTKPYLDAIKQNNKQIIDLCSQLITNILENEREPHLPKLLALKFINEAQETFQESWIKITAKKILPILENVGQYRKNSQDDNRGKDYFLQNFNQRKQYEKVKEFEEIGTSYFRYALESIWVWSKWFPLDQAEGKLSLYKIAQERLALMKVKFPEISYFSLKDVINHMQIQRPPKELLEECRIKIKQHIDESTQTDLQHYQALLDKTYFNEKNKTVSSTRTYAQVWQEAVDAMRKGKMGAEIEIKLKTCRIKQDQKRLFQASIHLNKSKMALQSQTIQFSSVLNEKEKLLTEINNHIVEKDALNKQLYSKNQEITSQQQQIELLKQQVIQLKVNNQQVPQNQIENPISQTFQSTKDLERLLQKREIELKRQQAQLQHYQSVIDQQNNNVSHLQTLKIQLDDELFKQCQKNLEQSLQIEELKNSSHYQAIQIDKLNEVLKQLKEQMQSHLKVHGEAIEKYTTKIFELEKEKTQLIYENQQVKQDLEQYKHNQQILQKENDELRKNYEVISRNQTTKQNYYKTEKPNQEGQSTIYNQDNNFVRLNRRNLNSSDQDVFD